MYYTLADAALQLGISRDKLRQMVVIGHLPKKWFGNTYVLDDADVSYAKELLGGAEPHTDYWEQEPTTVGYTLEHAAAIAGVSPTMVLHMAENGRIDAQQLGRRWMMLPGAIEQIKTAPRTQERKEGLTYRTNKGNPKPIPPLDERYVVVIVRYLAGESFSEIARDLGVSRERPSRMFATAKRRVELLRQRGITDTQKIAAELRIDVEICGKLIEQVK